MKFFSFLILAVVSLQSHADTTYKTCGANCVQEVGLPILTSSILSVAKSSDQGCPAPGSEVIPLVEKSTGKIRSSSATIGDLMTKTSNTLQSLKNNSAHCGECKQQNLVSSFTTTAPQELRADEVCPTPFARSFQTDLNNADIESFVDQTLRGKTPQGAKYVSDCANLCSNQVVSAQTALSPTTTRLNLVVICGPPRQGTLLLSTYQFSVGFIHQWICKK